VDVLPPTVQSWNHFLLAGVRILATAVATMQPAYSQLIDDADEIFFGTHHDL